jgi:hypothetical protein
MVLTATSEYFLQQHYINQLIFVMTKCDVLFEVRSEYLNIIKMSYSFKELSNNVMKTYESGVIVPLISNLCTRWKWSAAYLGLLSPDTL